VPAGQSVLESAAQNTGQIEDRAPNPRSQAGMLWVVGAGRRAITVTAFAVAIGIYHAGGFARMSASEP
jgi:hypothetical protein